MTSEIKEGLDQLYEKTAQLIMDFEALAIVCGDNAFFEIEGTLNRLINKMNNIHNIVTKLANG